MTSGKVVEGVFALNKPTGISSAQALNNVQLEFNKSKLFAPWISAQIDARKRENHNQRQRRKQKKVTVKIGHGGTLDPLATGVLICGVGKGTKVLQSFLECTKTYEAIILFGASTDTYDRTGKVLKKAPYHHITRDKLEAALAPFRGKIMQLPPLFSALKMDGKPLYEYAREGKEIPRQIQKRPVEVLDLELVEWMDGDTHTHKWPEEEAPKEAKDVAEKVWEQEKKQEAEAAMAAGGTSQPVPVIVTPAEDAAEEATKKRKRDEGDEVVSDVPTAKVKTDDEPVMSGGLPAAAPTDAALPPAKGPPAAKLRMTVTSGFYVRSLCFDLGEALGSAAVMAELVRTRQGQFELGKNVLDYAELVQDESVWGAAVEDALDGWSRDFRPFAGSTAEGNAQPAEVEAEVQAEPEGKQKVLEA